MTTHGRGSKPVFVNEYTTVGVSADGSMCAPITVRYPVNWTSGFEQRGAGPCFFRLTGRFGQVFQRCVEAFLGFFRSGLFGRFPNFSTWDFFFAMTGKAPWVPREHEAQLFSEVYMDESSQNGRHRFFVLGGIMLPMIYSDLFEAAMVEARPARLKRIQSNGLILELAWKHVSNGDYEDYKEVVDAYFAFKGKMNASAFLDYKFHCSVLDTTIEGRRYSRGLEGEDSFNREIFFLGERVARNYEQALFHIYPGRRSTIRPKTHLAELGAMINFKLLQRGDKRDFPIRRLDFRENRFSQALQISDLLIGAITYRINRHYDKPDANRDKKLLADYILKRGMYLPIINSGRLKSKNWGDFQVYVRRHKDWGPTTLHQNLGHGSEPGLS